MRTETRSALLVSLFAVLASGVLLAESLGAERIVLKHDDGEMDKHFSYGGSTAQTVAFETPGEPQYVFGVSVYGSQYGGQHDATAVNGDLYVLDENLQVVSRTSFPYRLFRYKKGWIEIPILPTRVSGKFYLALHAHSESFKGLYVGYDSDVAESHSSLGTVARAGFELRPTDDKLDWMIRAKLSDKPVFYEAWGE